MLAREELDAGAGLQYLNARYYDPELGLFLQPDWFEVTMAGVGTNRFSYSFNDPVNLRDPSGNEIGMGTAFSAYSIASSLSDQPGLTEAEIFSASMNALSGPGWLQALQAAPLLPFVTAEYSLATALGAYKVNKMKKNAGKLQFAQGQANIIKIAARNEYSERGGTGNHDVEGGTIGEF